MPQQPSQLVEHFFRHESAKLVSVLTRVFGFAQLPLVEDTVQSALAEALQQWKIRGIPENPSAWVHRVAKNKALDALRRRQTETRIYEKVSDTYPQSVAVNFEALFETSAVEDSLLRMMFACCHPGLDRHSQIALTLKILCGFSVGEIASALLVGEEAAKKRVYRAKKQLAETGVELELPAHDEMSRRLGSVREVLYLMFNEGYRASSGTSAIREDVCEEAARLCHLLCQQPETSDGSNRALLALMLYHAARIKSRTDFNGVSVLLHEQDRSTWDASLISHADYWLAKSTEGDISTFHLEAIISQIHCRAKNFTDTDWASIVQLYDGLIEIHPTPVYALNRAVAIAQTGEVQTAIDQLKQLASHPKMQEYVLLDCALAHCFQTQGKLDDARQHLESALTLAKSEHERHLIESRIRQLDDERSSETVGNVKSSKL